MVNRPRKLIYCAGEEGRVVLDIIRRSHVEGNLAFIDDDPELWETEIDGIDVIGGQSVLTECDPSRTECIVAFGHKSGRLELARTVINHGVKLFSVIDKDSTISPKATSGEGVIVNAGSYVGPGVELHDAVLLDSGVNVSHDVVLEAGVTVGPSATIAGGVEIGRGAYIGAGATIIDHLEVGKGAVVGAGAVVTNSVPPDSTVSGVPARRH